MASRPDVEINSNLQHKSKFIINFDRVPNFTFFCQTINIPGISIAEATQAVPFTDAFFAGTKATFEPLTATVLVDENLKSWFEIHNWLRTISSADGWKDPNSPKTVTNAEKTSTATITSLNGSLAPNVRFVFKNVFPSAIGDLVFDSRSGPDDVLRYAVRFRYTTYEPIILAKS